MGALGSTLDAGLESLFATHPGARAIIRVAVTRVADSCGFGVPRYDYAGPRDALDRWTETKGPAGLVAYREAKNARSIDGMAGYRNATPTAPREA